MARRRAKGDVKWRVPGRNIPIAYSTKATNDLIVALAEPGLTIAEVFGRVAYDQEAKAVLRCYIDRGHANAIASEWFR